MKTLPFGLLLGAIAGLTAANCVSETFAGVAEAIKHPGATNQLTLKQGDDYYISDSGLSYDDCQRELKLVREWTAPINAHTCDREPK